MSVLFFFYSILSLFSVLGFGFFFRYISKINTEPTNLGLTGIFGLFLLSIISSFTYLLSSHNYTHNLIILIFGIALFLIFSFKKKINLGYLIYCFILLISGFLIAKTNEDFPYYHLPNSLQFAQQKLQFGLGNLNHGFKHISSIFLLNSIFYFPKIQFYLFNIVNFFFLFFSVYYLLFKIFTKKNIIPNISKILYILSSILLLVKFSRLAEYGTDISGQILIIILTLFASNIIFKKKIIFERDKSEFLTLLILLTFSITIKIYFVIYLIIPIFIFFKFKNKIQIFSAILFSRNLIILCVPILFIIFFNFAHTGCFVYPLSFTCLPNVFEWGLSYDTVDYLNTHYELWAKAGKTPNYTVANTEEYVKGIYWISNWIENYFFTKVSDFILVIFTIILFFSAFFSNEIFFKKIKINNAYNKNFYFFYFFFLVLLSFWFLNFPQLRYGGYVPMFFVLVMPFSYYFSNYINFEKKKTKKKIIYLLLIAFTVFNLKNVIRINKEFNSIYLNNFENFPLFYVRNTKFEEKIINNHKVYLVQGMCWTTPSTCVRFLQFKIKEKKGYKFYSLK